MKVLKVLDYIPVLSSINGGIRLLDLLHVKKVHDVAVKRLDVDEASATWKRVGRAVVTLIPGVNLLTIPYDFISYILAPRPQVANSQPKQLTKELLPTVLSSSTSSEKVPPVPASVNVKESLLKRADKGEKEAVLELLGAHSEWVEKDKVVHYLQSCTPSEVLSFAERFKEEGKEEFAVACWESIAASGKGARERLIELYEQRGEWEEVCKWRGVSIVEGFDTYVKKGLEAYALGCAERIKSEGGNVPERVNDWLYTRYIDFDQPFKALEIARSDEEKEKALQKIASDEKNTPQVRGEAAKLLYDYVRYPFKKGQWGKLACQFLGAEIPFYFLLLARRGNGIPSLEMDLLFLKEQAERLKEKEPYSAGCFFMIEDLVRLPDETDEAYIERMKQAKMASYPSEEMQRELAEYYHAEIKKYTDKPEIAEVLSGRMDQILKLETRDKECKEAFESRTLSVDAVRYLFERASGDIQDKYGSFLACQNEPGYAVHFYRAVHKKLVKKTFADVRAYVEREGERDRHALYLYATMCDLGIGGARVAEQENPFDAVKGIPVTQEVLDMIRQTYRDQNNDSRASKRLAELQKLKPTKFGDLNELIAKGPVVVKEAVPVEDRAVDDAGRLLMERAESGDAEAVQILLKEHPAWVDGETLSRYLDKLSLSQILGLQAALGPTSPIGYLHYIDSLQEKGKESLVRLYEEKKELEKVCVLKRLADLRGLYYHYEDEKKYELAIACMEALSRSDDFYRARLLSAYQGEGKYAPFKDHMKAWAICQSDDERKEVLGLVAADPTMEKTTRARAALALSKAEYGNRQRINHMVNAYELDPKVVSFLDILRAMVPAYSFQGVDKLAAHRERLRELAALHQNKDPHSAGCYYLLTAGEDKPLPAKPSEAVKDEVLYLLECSKAASTRVERIKALQTHDDDCREIVLDDNKSNEERRQAARYLFDVTQDREKDYFGYIAAVYGDTFIPALYPFLAAQAKKDATNMEDARKQAELQKDQDPSGAGFLYAMMQDLGLGGAKVANPYNALQGKPIGMSVKRTLEYQYSLAGPTYATRLVEIGKWPSTACEFSAG